MLIWHLQGLQKKKEEEEEEYFIEEEEEYFTEKEKNVLTLSGKTLVIESDFIHLEHAGKLLVYPENKARVKTQ